MTAVPESVVRPVKQLSAQGVSAERIARQVGVAARTVTRIRTRPAPEPLVDVLGVGALPGAWVDDALCAQTDPEAFFPEKGGSTREAKAICKECPVRAECLEFALRNNERFGIFGGLSERERRRLVGAG